MFSNIASWGSKLYFSTLLTILLLIQAANSVLAFQEDNKFKDYEVYSYTNDAPSIPKPFVHPMTNRNVLKQDGSLNTMALEDYAYISVDENGEFDVNGYLPYINTVLKGEVMMWHSKSKKITDNDQPYKYGRFFDCNFASNKCASLTSYHTGIDWILGPFGEDEDAGCYPFTDPQNSHRPVYAINSGRVVYAGNALKAGQILEEGKNLDIQNGIGGCVIIKHQAPEGSFFIIPSDDDQKRTDEERAVKHIYSYYLHLDYDNNLENNGLLVSIGDIVTAGQQIGRLYHTRNLREYSDDDDVKEMKKEFKKQYKLVETKLTNDSKKHILGVNQIPTELFNNTYEYQPHLHFELWTKVPEKLHLGYVSKDDLEKGVYFSPKKFLEQKHKVTLWDIDGTSQYYTEIIELGKLGILKGAGGLNDFGKFNPEALLNRAEAAKIVVKAAEAAGVDTQEMTKQELAGKFSDFESEDWCNDEEGKAWCNEYIGKLYNLGSLSGYPAGRFLPGKNVSRAEMFKMVVSTFPPLTPAPDVTTTGKGNAYSGPGTVLSAPISINLNKCGKGHWFCEYTEKAQQLKVQASYLGLQPMSINPQNLSDIIDDNGHEIPASRQDFAKAVYDAYTIYKMSN
jgi:hypothetical protein